MDDFNDFLGYMVTGDAGSGSSSGGGSGCLSWVITAVFIFLVIAALFS